MAEVLSIRERIVVRVFEMAEAIVGVSKVSRPDVRGTGLKWDPTAVTFALLLTEGDCAETLLGDGATDCVFSLHLEALIGEAQTLTRNTSSLVNKFMPLLVPPFITDPSLTEPAPSGIKLAWDTVPAGPSVSFDPDGALYVGVQLDVKFRHDSDNMNQYGTAIPERSYTTLPDACLYPF